jgi:hypothetical protein
MGGSNGEIVRSQNNIGSGIFVGGDNRGSINYQMVDAQTKAWLAKTAKVAPDLACLLEKALSDGVISPAAVDALTIAAHNINADVADALMIAGSNINDDVADSLSYAGQNINSSVAESIRNSADKLAEERQILEQLLNSINHPAAQFQERAYQDESATPSSAIYVDANPPDYLWKAKLKIFGWGVLGGILLCLPLLYHMTFR